MKKTLLTLIGAYLFVTWLLVSLVATVLWLVSLF